ncbi:MAG TPA: ribulokinase [Phycisphaerae bacterium]|nr:ribulokinase [Phycisphaerae bacterium]
MAKVKAFALGLDFGTNSARALIVDPANGKEVATAVAGYSSGEAGIILDRRDPNVARQHPDDWLTAMCKCTKDALRKAKAVKGFKPEGIIGIGVDATASTPLPVDATGEPLVRQRRFAKNLNALAWLWKDHTSFAEAAQITAAASKEHPEYLAKCGGTYSSEWFWSKALHCIRVAPEVIQATAAWVEQSDFIPAVITGNKNPAEWKHNICAAGHKAMYHASWGLPAADFLDRIDPALGDLRRRGTYEKAYSSNERAGMLCPEWAAKMGLPAGIPVAVGSIDAHLGAVGAGVKPGSLAKILGTSSCDMMIHPNTSPLPDIPGLCGIVDGSIVPGYFGLEAGQSAVGDIFNWFVNYFDAGEKAHARLAQEASKLKPGESGLLALDWNNGNRTILVDPRLTGLLVGQTLHTTRAEVYRALIEGSAMGARMIMERLEEYGVKVEEVINCGGIAEKSPLVMQIYADVTGRPMKISRSAQTCALGAAIFGAVVAGSATGGYDSVEAAQARMCGLKPKLYKPDAKRHEVYNQLFKLYRQLHDAFGTTGYRESLHNVMKDLLAVRDRVRGIA